MRAHAQMLFALQHSPKMPFFLGFGTTKDLTAGINVAAWASIHRANTQLNPWNETTRSIYRVRSAAATCAFNRLCSPATTRSSKFFSCDFAPLTVDELTRLQAPPCAESFTRALTGAAARVHAAASVMPARACAAQAAADQRTRINRAWMMISTHSGEKSIPPSGGISRRTGRSTGSARLVSSAWAGE
jgi:hypothetical protein